MSSSKSFNKNVDEQQQELPVDSKAAEKNESKSRVKNTQDDRKAVVFPSRRVWPD